MKASSALKQRRRKTWSSTSIRPKIERELAATIMPPDSALFTLICQVMINAALTSLPSW